MQVKLLATTGVPDHARWISETAGMCYNKTDKSNKTDEEILEFLKEKWRMKHYSIFEFVHYTFEIEGISRVALAQITRHWNSSFMVKSGRYCKETSPEFHLPESLRSIRFDQIAYYDGQALDIDDFLSLSRSIYDNLIAQGVKTEDARYLLPQALTTNLRFQFSLKDWLCSIAPQRISKHAQAEIKIMCINIQLGLLDMYNNGVMHKFFIWYEQEVIKEVQR